MTLAARPPRPEDAAAVAALVNAYDAAYGPSAGFPIASDRAIVSGCFTGRMCSRPAATASAIGPQPAACAPLNAGSSPSTRPRSSHWRNPFPTLVNSEPEAIGQTTRSGSDQPSCSTVS